MVVTDGTHKWIMTLVISFRPYASRLLISSSGMSPRETPQYNWISFNWLPRSWPDLLSSWRRQPEKIEVMTNRFLAKQTWKSGGIAFTRGKYRKWQTWLFHSLFSAYIPIDLCIWLFCVMALGVWYRGNARETWVNIILGSIFHTLSKLHKTWNISG